MSLDFAKLWKAKQNPPKETMKSFEGKTILLTGATSGLGLEAAKKLAALNVSRLIITARTAAKGETAKQEIREHVKNHATKSSNQNDGSSSSTDIFVLPLNMSTLSGVRAFTDELRKFLSDSYLDAAILNVGVVQVTHKESSNGYEENIQINALSTTLLGLLILPLLEKSATAKNTQSHLTFISSSAVRMLTKESMKQYLNSPKPIAELSKATNFPTGFAGGQDQYAKSKLILEYAIRHMAALPSVQDASTGAPRVIVASACPGMCKSDLGRNYSESFSARILMSVVFAIFARSAEQGANTYISSLNLGADAQGKLWTNDEFGDRGYMVNSEEGKAFGDRAWKEIQDIIGYTV